MMSDNGKSFKSEKNEFKDSKFFDRLCVLHKELLPKLKNYDNNRGNEDYPKIVEWYPLANSYYQFTEDVDAFSRVHHLLDHKPQEFYITDKPRSDPCHEKDVHTQYLESIPMNFLILGKPDIGQEELGRKLAEYWKCIYIDPQVLIEDEIESGSKFGDVLKLNLRYGKTVGPDIIMKLLKDKITEPACQDKGFVLTGLPLICNNMIEDDILTAESTTVFNVSQVFEHTNYESNFSKQHVSVQSEEFTDTISIREEEFNINTPSESDIGLSEPLPDDIPQTISNDQQLDFIFNLFETPYIVIYIVCENIDVINQRSCYLFSYETDDNLNWENNRFSTTYFVHLPNNYPAHVSSQLDAYHQIATSTIEHYILKHNVEHIIKVDGRTTVDNMFKIVETKLKTLPLQRNLLVERFFSNKDEINDEGGEGGEGDGNTLQNIKNLSVEDFYTKYSKYKVVAKRFKWLWSNWLDNCPVSMKEETYLKGKSEWAVHFMNKIYFLSSEEACNKFIENPRNYLLPPFPKPKCKFFVFGPPQYGKSSVSKCISYLLNASVVTPNVIRLEYIQKKEKEIKDNIHKKALLKGIEILNEQRMNEIEEFKLKKENETQKWLDDCYELANQLDNIYNKLNELEKKKLMLSSFPIRIVKEEEIKIEEKTTLKQLFLQLKKLGLHELTQDDCKKFINDKELLLNYLPHSYKEKKVFRPAQINDFFVKNYANSVIRNLSLENITPTSSEIFQIFNLAMDDISDSWVVDDMINDIELIKQLPDELIADYIIILKDEPDLEFISKKILDKREFINFKEFFFNIRKTDAALRCPLDYSSSFQQHVIEEVIIDMIDNIVSRDYDEEIRKYKNQINNYISNWLPVENYFQTLNKKIIEINVTNKTLNELLIETVNVIEDLNRLKPTIYTNIDRSEEVQEFLETLVDGTEDSNNKNDLFQESRLFGETLDYCPVTFHNNWVLWKGKEEFTVKFEGKIYLLSCEDDMNAFLRRPRQYLEQQTTNIEFPPLRVCVIGVSGCGKTIVSKNLATNLGLRYINYDKYLKRYYENSNEVLDENQPLSEDILINFCNDLWYNEPLKRLGFVVDDFPKIPTDIDTMIKMKCIPDIIVYINISKEILFARLLKINMNNWYEEIEEQRILKQLSYENLLEIWEIEHEQRLNELLEIKKQEHYLKKHKHNDKKITSTINIIKERENQEDEEEEQEEGQVKGEEGEEEYDDEIHSQVSYNSITEQEDINEINKILLEQYPKPVYEEDFESEESASERFTNNIEEQYMKDIDCMNEIKEICQSQQLQLVDIDGDLTMEKLIYHSFIQTDKLKFRNESLFERCFDLTIDEADKLLDNGYYFLSKFGKTCPVQYYENINQIQLYLTSIEKGICYPIIHRQYIYFIVSNENRIKFKLNPLKYIKNVCNFPLIPIRIALIGPPKCGKTSLANRYQRDMGLKLISRGQSIRYVLDELPFSNLAMSMEELLRLGWELNDNMTMKCVQAASFNGNAMTQGIVFDGFPMNFEEIRILTKYGLTPHIIFDLNAYDKYFETSPIANCDNEFIYSDLLLHFRYSTWKKTSIDYRSWLNKEYQNVIQLPLNASKYIPCLWGIWDNAIKLTNAVVADIKQYYKYIKQGWPLRLTNMLVTPLEFLERQSNYKSFCPCCIQRSILRNGGEPPNHFGLIQYKEYFYWVCYEHTTIFLKNPEIYIFPISITSDLPKRLLSHQIDELDKSIEEFCVICYTKYASKPAFVEGDRNYAVLFREKIFTFDCDDCLTKFIENPSRYYAVNIVWYNVPYPLLPLNELPVLGFLEQSVVKEIIQIIKAVNRRRPFVPGLTVEQSAAIYMGILLKLNNPLVDPYYKSLFKELGEKEFERRSNDFVFYLEKLKSILNPHLFYHRTVYSSIDSFLGRILSNIDYNKFSSETVMAKWIHELIDRMNFTGEYSMETFDQ